MKITSSLGSKGGHVMWQDWTAFEERPGFLAWCEPAPEGDSEERYAVVEFQGSIRWARVHPNPSISPEYSSGAFYDDMPGGAVEACKVAAMKKRAKVAALLTGDI